MARTEIAVGFALSVLLAVPVCNALYPGCPTSAKRSITSAYISALDSRVRAYQADVGALPPQLQHLLSPPAIHAAKWKGPYTRASLLRDGWGRPFIYSHLRGAKEFEVTTYGVKVAPY